jgi:hypothetical protein
VREGEERGGRREEEGRKEEGERRKEGGRSTSKIGFNSEISVKGIRFN